METQRLRTIQQPGYARELLHKLVQSIGILPEGAYQIRDPSALPPALQRLVTYATNTEQSWACWSDEANHLWLFVAEMSMSLSREFGAPVLQVDQYREDGEIRDTGRWVSDVEAKWRRCAE